MTTPPLSPLNSIAKPLPFLAPTKQRSPRTSSRAGLVEATVTALIPRSSSLGDRIYAVFKTIDGSTLGFWSQADHPVLQTLQLGDTIMLCRKTNGRLTLAPQSAPSTITPFVLLQRLWRLL